jgi:hypothetical protein
MQGLWPASCCLTASAVGPIHAGPMLANSSDGQAYLNISTYFHI